MPQLAGRLKSRVRSFLSRPAVAPIITGFMRPVASYIPRAITDRIPLPRTVVVPVPGTPSGVRLESRRGDTVLRHAFWGGFRGREPETADVLLAIASSSRAFFDVGANIGLYAIALAARYPSLEVHAFEPVPRVHRCLVRNAALNNLPNLHVHEAAVGARSGPVTLYIPPHEIPLEASTVAGFRHGAEAVAVAGVTIDDVADRLGVRKLDLLKLDTEGSEHEIIEGGMRTLERDRPFIVCEVLYGQTPELALPSLLKGLGYTEIAWLGPEGPRWTSEIRGDPTFRSLNYLFVHESRRDDLPEPYRGSSTSARRLGERPDAP